VNNRSRQNAPRSFAQTAEEKTAEEVRPASEPGKLEPTVEVIDGVQGVNKAE
jgi:hypothetical protein